MSNKRKLAAVSSESESSENETKKRQKSEEGSESSDQSEPETKDGKNKVPERNNRILTPLFEKNGVLINSYSPTVVLGVGAPGSGKTEFTKYVIYQKAPYYKHGMVICCNPTSADEYDMLPEKMVKRGYEESMIEEFVTYQEENGFPLCFLVIDDFVGTVNLDRPIWRKLVTQFRKYKTDIYFLTQYLAKNVPPVLRQCTQQVYMFRTPEILSAKMLYNSFLSLFFKNFTELLRSLYQILPSKHHCFLLDVREMTLNVVTGPDPSTMPEWQMTWDLDESKISEESENMKDVATNQDEIKHHYEEALKEKYSIQNYQEAPTVSDQARAWAGRKAAQNSQRALENVPLITAPTGGVSVNRTFEIGTKSLKNAQSAVMKAYRNAPG